MQCNSADQRPASSPATLLHPSQHTAAAAAPAPAAAQPHVRLHGEAASQGGNQQLGAGALGPPVPPAATIRAAAARRVTP